MGSFPLQQSVYKWEYIKTENYIYLNKTKESQQTPGPPLLKKSYRLMKRIYEL